MTTVGVRFTTAPPQNRLQEFLFRVIPLNEHREDSILRNKNDFPSSPFFVFLFSKNRQIKMFKII